jgi:hypothetical protein
VLKRRRLNPVLADVRRVTGKSRRRLLPAVWSMLRTSYAAIGVPHGNPGELLADYPVWDIAFDAEGHPRAFTLFKRTPAGLKSAASGSDGTLDGRDTTKSEIARRFFQQGV